MGGGRDVARGTKDKGMRAQRRMKDAEEVMGSAKWMDDTLGQGPPKKNASFRTPPPHR
jgi:hypothetical protein